MGWCRKGVIGAGFMEWREGVVGWDGDGNEDGEGDSLVILL